MSPWLTDDHLGRQHPAKRLALAGQLGPPGTPAPDRAFTVPHQGTAFAWSGNPEHVPFG